MNKKYYKFLATFLMLATLASCENGRSTKSLLSGTTSDQSVVNVNNGTHDSTRSFKTKVIPAVNNGPGFAIKDANNNGVRDDIDTLIKTKYSAVNDINAATQYARAVQQAVDANSPSQSDVNAIFTALTAAVDCASAQMGVDVRSTRYYYGC
jgi:hypothetical protein